MMRFTSFAIAMLGALLLASGAHAQSPVPVQAPAPAKTDTQANADIEEAMQNERSLTAVPKESVICPRSDTGEIVVCAKHHTDTSLYRVPSSADEDPTSSQATRTGMPHAPDMYTHPSGGVRIGVGHVPPPIYYIDTTKLPQPPPGSDADKIAKGEMAAP